MFRRNRVHFQEAGNFGDKVVVRLEPWERAPQRFQQSWRDKSSKSFHSAPRRGAGHVSLHHSEIPSSDRISAAKRSQDEAQRGGSRRPRRWRCSRDAKICATNSSSRSTRTSRDLDDAVNVEAAASGGGWNLRYPAIADVTMHVKPGARPRPQSLR